MNILIASQSGVHPNTGGIERVSWDLAVEFTKLGHSVSFISSTPLRSSLELDAEFSNYYLPNSGDDRSRENIEYIQTLLAELSIDVVLNQSATIEAFSMAFLEACRGRCKVVSALHFNPRYHIIDIEDSYFLTYKLGRSVVKWIKATVRYLYYRLYYLNVIKKRCGKLYREVYEHSDAYVLLSKNFEKSFVKLSGLRSWERLRVINNPTKFARSAVEAKKSEILYVGRVERSQKRVDRLLPIWRDLYKDFPDWKLIICGNGSYRGRLERDIADAGLERVEFVGYVNPEEYFDSSSMLLMTSSSEGFGLVLVEAQQRGCIPMAYSSFESVTDIIENDKDGVLVTPFRQDEYVAKLRKLMSDKEHRAKLRENCTTKDYSQFDIKSVATKWVQLFEEVLSKAN